MSKTKFIDKEKLKHFEKQLAARDTYVKENGDYTLQADSPCIDSGTIIEDMEYCGSAPDMGAYEYITEDCEECGAELADVTGDGQINVLDLVQISYYVLELSTPAYPCAADYNQDGQVNILDLVQIANYILDN